MKKDPWNSIDEQIHHNNTECKTSVSVKAESLRQGTGDKPLCGECDRLSRKGQTSKLNRATTPLLR
jgi:hypothetical protein